jgi:PRC-barrel domain
MAMSERELNKREFGNLIGSDKVEGTAVFGPDDSKIGSIERVMIDKVSGRVSYAVLGFGGFMGLGNDHYPLPWQSLKYDTRLGGYRTGVTEDQLRGAPRYRNEADWNWSDIAATRSLNDYYGVPIP